MSEKFKALWIPFWYGMDHSAEVNKISDFWFYKIVPEEIEYMGKADRVIFNSIVESSKLHEKVYKLECNVISICNSCIGSILKIDTSHELSYRFYIDEKKFFSVDSEERPGRIESSYGINVDRINDWTFIIELEINVYE